MGVKCGDRPRWLLMMSLLSSQVGAERYNLFTGCEGAKTATFVLRGGSQQFLDEADRSLHDAIMIVRRALKNAAVLPGGGANDMEISRHLRHALTLKGTASATHHISVISQSRQHVVFRGALCE